MPFLFLRPTLGVTNPSPVQKRFRFPPAFTRQLSIKKNDTDWLVHQLLQNLFFGQARIPAVGAGDGVALLELIDCPPPAFIRSYS